MMLAPVQSTDGTWREVGALTDIPVRGARVVKLGTACIAVFRASEDSVFALHDRCPHKGGPLSQGIVHGTSVTCPLHNWVINLGTGQAEGADEGTVPTIPAEVRDGRIFLRL
jgi:nitrite reductase (NADH) small subunit